LGTNGKAPGAIAPSDDFGYQAGHCERQTVLKHRPCVGGVGKYLLEKRELPEQGGQNHQSAIAILYIGRCHQRVQQQPRLSTRT
jgi:hypothetical protein